MGGHRRLVFSKLGLERSFPFIPLILRGIQGLEAPLRKPSAWDTSSYHLPEGWQQSEQQPAEFESVTGENQGGKDQQTDLLQHWPE